METKFGIFAYNSYNIGDEIQSLAASRFLPKIDYLINREKTNSFSPHSSQEEVKVIMNAWYMWRPKNFPPSKYINPLFVSTCFSKQIQNSRFLTSKTIGYLREHGPIGCRDMGTLSFLEKNSIPAYFSGCLTLTLQGSKVKKDNYVLCVDVSQEVVEAIKKKTSLPVVSLSKLIAPFVNSKNRFLVAKAILFAFQNAHVIFTSNLHTVLPALSLETPVCFLNPGKDDQFFDWNGRFSGLKDLFFVSSIDDFVLHNSYDVNCPPKNPVKYLDMREKLILRCEQFTGFDSKKPLFEDGYDPSLDLLYVLRHSENDFQRSLMFATPVDLFKALWERTIKHKNYLDIQD